MSMSEEWITMQEAAKRLSVGRNKISRLVSRGVIQTKDNPLDARVRLVNLNEVRVIFETYGVKGENVTADDET